MTPSPAESQSESEALFLDPSQPFESRDDDDDDDDGILYKVTEITGETKDEYKVRWKGNDPKTEQPWPQGWISKRDCTDDLVLTWKKQKERRNQMKSGPTAGNKFRSESTPNITTSPKGRTPTAGHSNIKSASKHRFEEDHVKEEDELESADERDLLLGRQRPSASVGHSNASPSPPLDNRPKGTKRKRETKSANSSTNRTAGRRIETVPVDVDNDEGQTTRRIAVLVSNAARKKKRIISDLESPFARRPLTHQREKYIHDVRNSGRFIMPSDGEKNEVAAVVEDPLRAYDEEEEEIMVEVALSDNYHSAGTNDLNDESRNNDFELDPRNGKLDVGNQQIKGNEKGKTVQPCREEEEGEFDGVEFLLKPDQRPQSQSKAATITHVRPSKRPRPRMVPQPPPPHWKTPSNKHRSHPAIAEVPKLGSKPLNKIGPAATSKKFKDPSFVAQSSSNLNPRRLKLPLFKSPSDSDRSPPPERHRKPEHPKPAMKRSRIVLSDVISIHDSDDAESEMSLSPGARQRLAIFDAEVMGKKPRVVEKKRVNEVNSRGEVSALKCSGPSPNSRPATSAVRPTQRFDTQTFNMDIVPETEHKNSQEDKLQTLSIAIDNHDKRDVVPPIASSTGLSITKSLRPLPHIHAHLKPPNSTLPNTIVEPSSSHQRRPEIEEMWNRIEGSNKGREKERSGSLTPSGVSSSKRKMEFLEVGLPGWKRRRMSDGEVEEGQFAVLVEALRRMEESSARTAASNENLAAAIDRLSAVVAKGRPVNNTVGRNFLFRAN